MSTESTYSEWHIENWDTPLSQEDDVVLDSLVSDRSSILTARYCTQQSVNRSSAWSMSFRHPYAFRVLNESFMNGLWERWRKAFSDVRGPTAKIHNSSWLHQLRQDFVFAAIEQPLSHYVITTSEDVLEVISYEDPQILEVPL